MKELSGRQAEVFEFIKQAIGTTGAAPTLHEIRKHLGYRSLGSVSNIIETLIRKGILDRDRFRYRGIRLKYPQSERRIEAIAPICVPLLNNMLKRAPLLSLENIVQHLCFDKKLIGEKKVFCIRAPNKLVQGVKRGDYLIVSDAGKPKLGDLVVHLEGGRMAVSRKMHATDKGYLGKVIGLFRPMTHAPGE